MYTLCNTIMNSLFSPTTKRARHLWNNILPIIFYWSVNVTSISLVLITWLFLQWYEIFIEKHMPKINNWSVLDVFKPFLTMVWILVVIKHISLIPEFSLLVIVVTVVVISGGVRVMIFPISIICFVWSFFVWDSKYKHLQRVAKLMNTKQREEYQNRSNFYLHICFHSVASMAILFLLAAVPRMFEVCIILGTINFALAIFMASLNIYDSVIFSLPLRVVLGESISSDIFEDLEHFYSDGFDTNRFQYLMHDSLRKGRRLNTIRALIGIFPNDIMKVVDDEGNTPFQVACQYSSARIVNYLIGTDSDLLDSRDDRGDTALHYACRGKNYGVVKYLLSIKMGLATKRNAEGDLPVYLLCGADNDSIDSPEHVETILWLLLAYPEDMA